MEEKLHHRSHTTQQLVPILCQRDMFGAILKY
jgi:hypothetical protein